MHPQTFNLKLEYRIFAATERINKNNRNAEITLKVHCNCGNVTINN